MDTQAALRQQFRAEGLLDLAARILDEVRILRGVGLAQRLEDDRRLPRGVGLGRGDRVIAHHQRQDGTLPPLDRAGRAIRVPQPRVGVVIGRRLGQSGQQRGFGQRQIGRALVEVGFGGRLDAVGQVAVIDLVEIDLEDFVFRIAPRDFGGQDRLFDLPGQRPFGGEEGQLDQLLGDRAAAGGRVQVAIFDRVIERAGDADGVHAGVLIEIGVFSREGGRRQVRRDGRQRDRGAPAIVRVGHFVQQPARPVVDQRRVELAGAGLQLIGRGQRRGDAGIADEPGADEQQPQRRAEQQRQRHPPTAGAAFGGRSSRRLRRARTARARGGWPLDRRGRGGGRPWLRHGSAEQVRHASTFDLSRRTGVHDLSRRPRWQVNRGSGLGRRGRRLRRPV